MKGNTLAMGSNSITKTEQYESKNLIKTNLYLPTPFVFISPKQDFDWLDKASLHNCT